MWCRAQIFALFMIASAVSSVKAIQDTPIQNVPVLDGFTGVANTVVEVGGVTYVGGNFDNVGPYTGTVVSVDIATAAVGLPFPKANNRVSAIISDGSGGYYIAGAFTRVGTEERAGIAHILADGSVDPAFVPLSPGTGQYSYGALALVGSTLYVGGTVSGFFGEEIRNGMLAVNAATAALLPFNSGTGFFTAFSTAGTVSTIVVSGSTMYVGGNFASIGGVTRNNLAAFDTTTNTLTSWNPNADFLVTSMILSGSNLYVGGGFSNIGGLARGGVAIINTTTGLADAAFNADTFAVLTMALSGGTLYIGGNFITAGGQNRNRIAALSATTGVATAWNPDCNNPNGIQSLLVIGSTVYAGGRYESIGGQNRNNLAALDATTGLATSWNPNPGGRDSPSVGVMIQVGSAIYIGGNFTTVGAVPRKGLFAFNTATGAITSFDANIVLSGGPQVDALAVSGTTLYVVGSFTSAGGQLRNHAAAFDTNSGLVTAWNPNSSGTVRAIAISGSTVYLGGTMSMVGSTARSNVAAVNDSNGALLAWNPNADGFVDQLLVSGTTVYACGTFNNIGGQARKGVAALDGTSGSAIVAFNAACDGSVSEVVLSGTTLYAGGLYNNIGGQARTNLAALDATTEAASSFNPGTAGTSNVVNGINLSGSTLYVGGTFSSIAGQARFRAAGVDTLTGSAIAWNPGPVFPGGFGSEPQVVGSRLYVKGAFIQIGGDWRHGLSAFELTAPAPTASSLSPSSIAAGSADFTLSVRGTGFNRTSIVSWNGSDRTTTFISDTELRITVPAADIAASGTASLSVLTPAPGGGTSGALTFTIGAGGGGPTSVAITSPLAATGKAGIAMSYTIAANGSGTITFGATGLPSFLTLNGAVISGTPTIAGSFAITLTATNGSTSDSKTLVLTVLPATASNSEIDSDGDGFSDELETALGTSPSSSASTPFGGAPAGIPQTLTLPKLALSLNFSKSGSDQISGSGTLPVPDGFVVAGQVVAIDIGGAVVSFTLDARGKSPKGINSFALQVRAKKGVVAAQTSNFKFKLKGSFASLLTDEQLANATLKDAQVTVPVRILFNQAAYDADSELLFSAKEGKTGKTKIPK
jgi:hypothetical protein